MNIQTATFEVKPKHYKNSTNSAFKTPLALAATEYFENFFRIRGDSKTKIVIGDPGDGYLAINGRRFKTSLAYEPKHPLRSAVNKFGNQKTRVTVYNLDFFNA